MPGQVELPHLPGEVDQLVVGLGGLAQPVLGRGPVEEGKGLEDRDAVSYPTAFLDHAADDARGEGVDGRDLGEVERERGDCEVRVRRRGVGVGAWVFPVVPFDEGVKFVGD